MRRHLPPLLHPALAVLLLGAAHGAVARAAAAPPADPASVLVGSWTGHDDGEYDEARFDPDGTYVYQTQYPGGATIRSWGRYAMTAAGPGRFFLSLTPSGWSPKRYCGPRGRDACRPLELHPERLPLATMPHDAIDFGGVGDAFDDPEGATTMTRSKPDPALVFGAPS